MPNHGPGSPAGSAPDGGGLWPLFRNLLIVAVVAALAAWALSFRSEVSRALHEALPDAPLVALTDEAASPEESGEEADEADGEADGEETDETLSSELAIRKDASGHFLLEAVVQGVAIRFLVDTGASDVVLSPEDARRLHLNAAALDFSLEYQTANGTVRAAPVRLRHVRVGQLELTDVEASVNEAPMGISLLGMSFLERLDGYAVEGDRLILRW
jgi:clan AA aspartic protease (TIGR02281 family)